ncbi:hypothetical protein Droror1_Dr00024265 [Drosera rotundifolia]
MLGDEASTMSKASTSRLARASLVALYCNSKHSADSSLGERYEVVQQKKAPLTLKAQRISTKSAFDAPYSSGWQLVIRVANLPDPV